MSPEELYVSTLAWTGFAVFLLICATVEHFADIRTRKMTAHRWTVRE